jgi:ribose 5-phosphate isomerase B
MGKILIASDHAGFELKAKIKKYFSDTLEFEDFGTNSTESVDYSDFIHPLAKKISDNPTQRGIIICGSGNGVSMTANKYPNVRAALCWSPEIAKMAREHNDNNILSLPARYITFEDAVTMINLFLTVPFEGGRHQRRVEKINM